jgi:hypothetical protein
LDDRQRKRYSFGPEIEVRTALEEYAASMGASSLRGGELGMTVDSAQLAGQFFAAARALAMHRGTLQDGLADAYADHLLAVSVHDLPTDLQGPWELEDRLNREIDDEGDDPIAQSASCCQTRRRNR